MELQTISIFLYDFHYRSLNQKVSDILGDAAFPFEIRNINFSHHLVFFDMWCKEVSETLSLLFLGFWIVIVAVSDSTFTAIFQ